MTKPRRNLVCVESTPYYHVISRCVRRAFLCGEDQYSGYNYEHRRLWVLDRLALLADVFSIKLCSYAILSNHYHLVVFIDNKQVEKWSNEEVMDRWLTLFNPPVLVERFRAKQTLCNAEKEIVNKIINTWRERLGDLSWFMKCLNEHIARKSNAEDGCKGAFWESRYKSQALLTEKALLNCLAYVDLNPVRAAMADTLEKSDFTSVQQRIRAVKKKNNVTNAKNEIPLMAFKTTDKEPLDIPSIPFHGLDYLKLVDWTGRQIRSDKRGAITADVPALLNSLGISEKEWISQVNHFNQRHYRVVGSMAKAMELAKRVGQQWFKVPRFKPA